MDRWRERLEQHPVWRSVEAVETQIDRLKEHDSSAEATEFSSRFRTVADAVRARLEATDPKLAIPSSLDNLNGYLTEMANRIVNAISASGGDVLAYLQQADTYADNAVGQLIYFDQKTVRGEMATVRRTVKDIEDASNAELDRLRAEVVRADADVAQLRVTISEAETETATRITEVDQRVTDISARIDQFQATFDQHQSDRQTAYERQQAANRKAFEDALQTQEREVEGAIGEFESRAKTVTEGIQSSGAATLESLADMHDKAEALLDAIGTRGMAAGHQEFAHSEERRAGFWRWAAVLVMVCASLALAAVLFGTEGNISEHSLPVRLALPIALYAVARYAARESGRHRAEAHRLRDVHLRMTALPPYLASLDDKDQDRVKLDLAYLFFVASRPADAIDGSDFDPSKGIVDGVREWVRRRQGTPPA